MYNGQLPLRSASVSLLLILISCHISLGQNLVPNPGFEDLIDCPGSLGQIDLAEPWTNSNGGTADIFNVCASGDASIPSNAFGDQTVYEGEGYAGIKVFDTNNQREYLTVELPTALEAGNQYCVSFQTSLSSSSAAIAEMGAFFSTFEPTANNGQVLNYLPQVVNETGVLADANNWQQVSGVFEASQNFNYLTIGNYLNNTETTLFNTDPGAPFDSLGYYYIDLVSVVQIPPFLVNYDPNLCVGETSTIEVFGGETYFWYDLNNPNPFYTAQSYTFTATESRDIRVVAITGNCARSETFHIEVAPYPNLATDLGQVCAGQATEVTDLSDDVTSNATYLWDFGNDGSIEETTFGGASFLPSSAGLQTLALTINNGGDCSSTQVFSYEVIENCNSCSDPSNLVPNGSFEVFNACPDGLNDMEQLTGWLAPSSGTPDAFHECFDESDNDDSNNVGVPANTFGVQTPFHGNAYAGIYAAKSSDNYREYISTKLSQPLLAGRNYCVSFQVSPGDYTALRVDKIGAHFSQDAINSLTQNALTEIPQIQYEGALINNETGWVEIQGTFEASGNYEWITIGNFLSNNQTNIEDEADALTVYNNIAYLYVDAVEVFEIPTLSLNGSLNICQGDQVDVCANEDFCEYKWFADENLTIQVSNTACLNVDGLLPGFYTYHLLAGNGDCAVKRSVIISVDDYPDVSFTGVPNCVDNVTTFTDESLNIAEGATYGWDFNTDGDIDATLVGNIGHIFTEPGLQTVSLTVTNPGGCADTYSFVIDIPAQCDPCLPANLVSNGSFEIASDCPSENGQIGLANIWYSPTSGTPDYFSSCAPDADFSVPANYIGYQEAETGSAYAGLFAYDGNINNLREYISTSLLTELEAGQQYCLSFKVSLGEESDYAVGSLGAYLTTDSIGFNQPVVIAGNPQVSYESVVALGDQVGWQEITGTFTATEDYRFLTIGNFNDDLDSFVLPVGDADPDGKAFYYVDDITLVQIELEFSGTLDVCEGDVATVVASSNFCEYYWTTANEPDVVIDGDSILVVSPNVSTTYLFHGENDLCEVVQPVVVNVNNTNGLTVGADVNLCEGSAVQLSAFGGTSYLWGDHPSFVSPLTDQNPIVEPTSTTTYQVIITDANTNCEVIREVTVNVFGYPDGSAGDDILLCTGDATQLGAYGGDVYQWTAAPGISNLNIPNPVVNPSVTTTYSVTITDSTTGCSVQDEVTVTVKNPDTPLITEENMQAICVPGNTAEEICLDFEYDGCESLNLSVNNNDNINIISDNCFVYQSSLVTDTITVSICTESAIPACSSTTIVFNMDCDTPPQWVENETTIPVDTIYINTLQNLELDFELPDQYDPDIGDVLTSTSTNGTHGSVFILGEFATYNPNYNFVGTDVFYMTLCDSLPPAECDELVVIVNVAPIECPPDIIIECVEVNETAQVCLEYPCLAQPVINTGFSGSQQNASLNFVSAQCISYTPPTGFEGVDTAFVYALGLYGQNDTSLAVINVGCTSPIAADDFYVVPNDDSSPADVLANDLEPCGDNINLNSVSQGPTNGTAEIVGGELIYTPDELFLGNDTLIYQTCNTCFPNPICDLAMAIFSVVPGINTPPMIGAADTVYLSTYPDSTLVECFNIIDAQLNDFNFLVDEAPDQGTAFTSDTCLTYIADNTFLGTDELLLISCDEMDSCSYVTVFVDIEMPNLAPEAEDVYIQIMQADSALVCLEAFDPNGDEVEATVTYTSPFIAEVFNEDSCLLYVPEPLYAGLDSFQVALCDPEPLCDTAWVYIEIIDGLIAEDDYYNALNGEPIVLDILDNDTYPDLSLLSVNVIQNPVHGDLNPLYSDSSFFYTPQEGYEGLDSLIYFICDPLLGCDTATVYLNLDYIVQANPDTIYMEQDTSVSYNILANDFYPTLSSVTILQAPLFGTANIGTDNFLNYTPNPGFNGGDNLTYILCGDPYGCDTTTVLLYVGAGIVPPTAVNDFANTGQDECIDVAILANDFDPNDEPIYISEIGLPSLTDDAGMNGTVSLNSDSTLQYCPPSNTLGVDTIQYYICNQYTQMCSWALVIVTIDQECNIFIPNAISPNGDGKNDMLQISGLTCRDYSENELLIFNRYGDEVYKQDNYPSDGYWAGQWDDNGEDLPDGTYFYLLKLDNHPSEDFKSGFIELSR